MLAEDYFQDSPFSVSIWDDIPSDLDDERLEQTLFKVGGNEAAAFEQIAAEERYKAAGTDPLFNDVDFLVRESREADAKHFEEVIKKNAGANKSGVNEFFDYLHGFPEEKRLKLEDIDSKTRVRHLYDRIAQRLGTAKGDIRLWELEAYGYYCTGARHDRSMIDDSNIQPGDEDNLYKYEHAGPWIPQEDYTARSRVQPMDTPHEFVAPEHTGRLLIVEIRPENERVALKLPQSLEPVTFQSRDQLWSARVANFKKNTTAHELTEPESFHFEVVSVDTVPRYFWKQQDADPQPLSDQNAPENAENAENESTQNTASIASPEMNDLSNGNVETQTSSDAICNGDSQCSSRTHHSESNGFVDSLSSEVASLSLANGPTSSSSENQSLPSPTKPIQNGEVPNHSSQKPQPAPGPWFVPRSHMSRASAKNNPWFSGLPLPPGKSPDARPPSSTLYHSLGYLSSHPRIPFHCEDKDFNARPNRFRAPQVRTDLAKFLIESAEVFEASGLLEQAFNSLDFQGSKISDLMAPFQTGFGEPGVCPHSISVSSGPEESKGLDLSQDGDPAHMNGFGENSKKRATARDFARLILSLDYAGSELDLWLYAAMHGVIVQVWDVASQTMRAYGRGSVEFYCHPDRPEARDVRNIVRWKDGEFDPISCRDSQAMQPQCHEHPYDSGITDKIWGWFVQQDRNALRPLRECHFCEKESEDMFFCGFCRAAFYCNRRCQRKKRLWHGEWCADIKWVKGVKRAISHERHLFENTAPDLGLAPKTEPAQNGEPQANGETKSQKKRRKRKKKSKKSSEDSTDVIQATAADQPSS